MPSGYRPGIPQRDQAYTKWEADRDEVEVDFKHHEQVRKASWFSGPKGTVLKVLLILVMFLLGLIIGYMIRRSVHRQSELRLSCPYYTEGYERYSSDISTELQKRVSTDNIKQNLLNYTSEVHISGTHNNNMLRELIRQQLNDLDLRVSTSTYTVLMSYPDWEQANRVSLLDENKTVMYETSYHGPLHDNHPELTTPYLSFSPNGTVTGELVYANYGEQSDFDYLGLCTDKIVIMRTGKIYRGAQVENAYRCGAAGVILYPDPSDVTFHMTSDDDVYPSKWYLPGWSTQRDTVLRQLTGDPLTPGHPSTAGMVRLDMSQADLPKIPAQCVGYDAAQEIMMHMAGKAVNDFVGAMHQNVTYRIGPGYSEPREKWKVKLEVFNELHQREITNVIGLIKGHEEPDRYVIVGVHYDAWTFGAADGNIGTAIMMEISKAMAELTKKGWKPRRTIMFIHWDGEEQGNMGSYEWVEEHGEKLRERTVAYINLDRPVTGSYTLDVEASPEIQNLMVNVTHMFPAAGNTHGTVYQQWSDHSPDDITTRPRMKPVGGGSDQAPFLFMLGVPVIWPAYIHDTRDTPQYPAYHTDIDTFDYYTQLVDPQLQATLVYTKIIGELVLQLSSLTRLPFDVRALATATSDSFNTLKSYLTRETFKDIQLLEPLHKAISDFTEVAARFHDNFQQVDLSDVLELRRYNDRAMKVSRCFIHPDGLPERPQYKNVLFAPSMQDTYTGSTFTGIRDAFTRYNTAKESNQSKTDVLWQDVLRQISIATLSVQSATSLINEDPFP